jgi:heavy metal translocating P-type ATPase
MKPYLFDEFFASDKEESISPFLTPGSRNWGKNLSLRSASIAAFFLVLAFSFSFINQPLSYIFLTITFFLSGVPALIASIDDFKNFEINIDVLMTLAAFVAAAIGSGMEGALLLVLFELSHGMEDSVSKKTRSALHNLNNIAPKFALVLDADGTPFEKSVREIQVGEKLIVKHGEIFPLDGTVLQGASSINLVHLTGESIPISKTVGDTIPAGARNLEAALVIEVNRTSSDSTLARIIQLITAAAEAKPKLQRWLDRFGKHYATTIIVLTIIFAILLPIYSSLAFLIAASPCALIIATPTAYLSAISACARRGILLKGGITIDALASCHIIAFDKTGTLTTGELQCTAMEPYSEKALSIAYGLERHVTHPIANAISRYAQNLKIPPAEITSFRSVPGSHIEGLYDNIPVSIGRATQKNALATLTIDDTQYHFRFSDQIRNEMGPLIQKIKLENHLKPVILSGDKMENVRRVGQALGITDIYASLHPEDKLAKVESLSQQGGLAMVGDGINDAPALARATVGISMGRVGSATAVDASDVVLLNDDIHLLSWLFTKAHKTTTIVKQNITLALAVICLASIPALLGLLPLWAAVILHEGGTVLVGLNSLRLLKR